MTNQHVVRIKASALAAIPVERLHDRFGRRAGGETRDVRNVDPSAALDFIAGARLGALRDIADEHMMMLLSSAMLKQELRRFAGKTRFFLEFAQRGVVQMLATFEHAAGQRPFGAASRNQQNVIAAPADDRSSLPQTGSE
jgi:hypothetical protein